MKVILWVISWVTFGVTAPSLNLTYTFLVPLPVVKVWDNDDVQFTQFVGLDVFQYATWIDWAIVESTGQVIFNVTFAELVLAAQELIVKLHQVGGVISTQAHQLYEYPLPQLYVHFHPVSL